MAAITANPIVSQGLAVMDAANEAAAPLFAAALAFATLFAVIPLILLVAGVIGWLVQDPAQREALLDQLVNLIPPLADSLRADARQPRPGERHPVGHRSHRSALGLELLLRRAR